MRSMRAATCRLVEQLVSALHHSVHLCCVVLTIKVFHQLSFPPRSLASKSDTEPRQPSVTPSKPAFNAERSSQQKFHPTHIKVVVLRVGSRVPKGNSNDLYVGRVEHTRMQPLALNQPSCDVNFSKPFDAPTPRHPEPTCLQPVSLSEQSNRKFPPRDSLNISETFSFISWISSYPASEPPSRGITAPLLMGLSHPLSLFEGKPQWKRPRSVVSEMFWNFSASRSDGLLPYVNISSLYSSYPLLGWRWMWYCGLTSYPSWRSWWLLQFWVDN